MNIKWRQNKYYDENNICNYKAWKLKHIVKQIQEKYCKQTLQHVLTLKHEQSVEHSHTLGHEQSTEHVHVQILVTQHTTHRNGKYTQEKRQIYG